MSFPDLNDNGKIDAEDVFIYEEILLEKKKDKKKPEPTGCCVIFFALSLSAILTAYKFIS